MKLNEELVINVEHKEHVTVNKCTLPEPIGVTVVRLNMKVGNESRFRLRITDDIEGRISTSTVPHYQMKKRHKNKSIYVLQNGWIAILLKNSSGYEVRAAFARDPERFYVEVPGNEWYFAYLSKNTAFSYSSSDNDTGEIGELDTSTPSEHEILSMYAAQESLTLEKVESLVNRSFNVNL